MTLIDIQDRLKQQVRASALELFGVELEQVNAETPPRAELGDVAFPVAFELAKLVKQGTGVKVPPRTIAEKLKTTLETSAEIARVEVAGAGYLNVFFDRARLLSLFAVPRQPEGEPSPLPDRPKKMVEHTSINPNKAAHIGTCETQLSAIRLYEFSRLLLNVSKFRITSTTPASRLPTL